MFWAQVVFWLCAATAALAWLVYPAALLWRARRAGLPEAAEVSDADLPALDVVLTVADGGDRAAAKLRELLVQDYPVGKLHVVAVDDGSTDGGTAALLRAASQANGRAQVILLPGRRGKATALNLAVAACRAPVVVFTDQRQELAPGALRVLAARFADPDVGAVSGCLELEDEGRGVGLYWRFEKLLRAAEGALGVLTGVTGALYALRREHWSPLPADAILDDVTAALRVRACGRAVVFEPRAVARDHKAPAAVEFRRKVRTLAGNVQVLLNPERYGPWNRAGVWPVFLGHKIARIAAAWALPPMTVAAVCASSSGFVYAASAFGLAASAALGLWGLASKARAPRAASAAAAFLLLQAAAVTGTVRYFTTPASALWSPTRILPEAAERRAA